MTGYCFESKANPHQYLSFSQEIGRIQHDSENDHAFLSNFYIIQQSYFKQKSKQELEQLAEAARERKKHEDAGEDVPEHLVAKVEELDNEFTIWNFAYEETEKSAEGQLAYEAELAKIRKKNNKKTGTQKTPEPPRPPVEKEFKRNQIY